ncbi:MAG: Asp-tRNA(Asn)/Glu-tRNA(Gln) amidotransferase GatCAB subunit B, partial [Candidatus Omnitrophica bacterium]|nr:Asp-tRNA(Asn)/Glu-tRNA(Gln) amidotransferase GatCAB subunit B [Candidatus Omnitrophota bacterium]
EIKNLNSFKSVREALAYEIERHIETLNAGEKINQETRLWDEKAGRTVSMRSKEEAKDYRYFPEPDLPPFIISKEKIEEIKKTLPELPKEKTVRFMNEYGLSEYDARILVADKQTADYAEIRLKSWPGKNRKPVANWLIGPLLSTASTMKIAVHEVKISPKDFLDLIDLTENKQVISNLSAKIVLDEMAKTGKPPMAVIQEKNLAQISDESSLEKEIDTVIRENPKVISDVKSGKANTIMFLVGQVMKKTKGKANPKIVQDILKRRLSDAQ